MKKTIITIFLVLCFFGLAFSQVVTKLTDTSGRTVNPATADNQTNGNQKVQVTSMPSISVSSGATVTTGTASTTDTPILSIDGTVYNTLTIYAPGLNGIIEVQGSADNVNWRKFEGMRQGANGSWTPRIEAGVGGNQYMIALPHMRYVKLVNSTASIGIPIYYTLSSIVTENPAPLPTIDSTNNAINPATSDVQTNGSQITQVSNFPSSQDVVVTSGTVTANIGSLSTNTQPVTFTNSSLAVTGTFWQSSQPVVSTPASGTTTTVQGTVTVFNGTADAGNSTTSTLGSNATFTGTWLNVFNQTVSQVTITSNVSSASNGVHLQFSNDGSAIVDDYTETLTVSSASGLALSVPVRGQYFRLVYTNGASAQGSFNAYTIHKVHSPTGDIMEVSDAIVSNDHAQLTKSILYDSTGRGLVFEQMTNDGEAGTDWGIPSESYGMMYDPVGASWNKVRGDTTNGLFVNVKSATTITTQGTTQIANASKTQSAMVLPTRALMVAMDGTVLFSDTYDGTSIDTTNRWNAPVTAGTGTVTQSNGNLTFSLSTTANNAAAVSSQATFVRLGFGFLKFGIGVQLESAPSITNTHRFWGVGNPNASFTATTPLADAVGFEIKTDGLLYATVWAGNSEILATALTRPADGAFHSYVMLLRDDTVFWFIDDLENPVTFAQWKSPNTSTLPVRIHEINNSSPPLSAPTLVMGGLGLADSSISGSSLQDGVSPWRKATVKAGSTAAVAGDTSLVVAISPNNAIPAGGNTIGNVKIINSTGTTVADFVGLNVVSNASGTTLLVLSTAQTTTPGTQSAAYMSTTTGAVRSLQADIDGTLYTRPYGPVRWSCFLASIGTTTTQCQALVTNYRLYVTDVSLSSTTSTTTGYRLLYGTGSNCATGPTGLYPASASVFFVGAANTTPTPPINFRVPLAVPTGNALCVLGNSGTNTINVQINGYTAP